MTKNPDSPDIVLVIEDDPILMMAMVDFVERAGFQAEEAFTVDYAIHLLETRSDIRTVFSDLDMRGSTAGMKLAMSIRDRWPPIELLMLSSQPWREVDLPKRGILVAKPFDPGKIITAIRQLAA